MLRRSCTCSSCVAQLGGAKQAWAKLEAASIATVSMALDLLLGGPGACLLRSSSCWTSLAAPKIGSCWGEICRWQHWTHWQNP